MMFVGPLSLPVRFVIYSEIVQIIIFAHCMSVFH